MKALENKIPPPALMLVLAATMWGVTKIQSPMTIEPSLRIGLMLALGLFAFVFSVGGVIAFRIAKTTINPVQIDRASRVVTAGVYRLSRNPMYVGLTALLAVWALFLAVPVAGIGPIVFALFTHRFQILPEERMLAAKFGREYLDYQQRVRRWV
ncbi:MAG TPA: isoprenylcysteine carboxylmethyltransferase family protein [Verrucomicrobiae bacterium]